VKGDVTLAPFEGATTEMPVVNFALIEADGVAHPDIANPTRRPAKPNELPAPRCSSVSLFSTVGRLLDFRLEYAGYEVIRTLPHSLGRDIRAPNCELDQGVKRSSVG